MLTAFLIWDVGVLAMVGWMLANNRRVIPQPYPVVIVPLLWPVFLVLLILGRPPRD